MKDDYRTTRKTNLVCGWIILFLYPIFFLLFFYFLLSNSWHTKTKLSLVVFGDFFFKAVLHWAIGEKNKKYEKNIIKAAPTINTIGFILFIFFLMFQYNQILMFVTTQLLDVIWTTRHVKFMWFWKIIGYNQTKFGAPGNRTPPLIIL